MTAVRPTQDVPLEGIGESLRAIGRGARAAAERLAGAPSEAKRGALVEAAQELRRRAALILAANAEDLAAVKGRATSAFPDPPGLDWGRVEAMAKGLEGVAALPDPVGSLIAALTRPNGLNIQRVRGPLGVIGGIYESRPNVT